MDQDRQNSAPEHEDIVIPFGMLHFDPVNPRGEPESNEDEIRRLFGSQDQTLKLATHLAENGQNPLDRFGIIAHPKLPNHFVVREGNRRLCAMQLLRDPNRAPTTAARKAFQNLARTGRPIPDEVQAVLFHEPGDARIWMSVKHEGPQGGLGTLPWGSKEKTRFNREGETGTTRPKNPNRQAESLLAYAVKEGLITHEENKLIALTTITRYLPSVRKILALLNSEDCTTNAKRNEFNAALQRFLKDAKNDETSGVKAAVHSRSSSAERSAYAETLRREGVSPSNRDLPSYDPSTPSQTKPAGKGSAAPKSAPDPSKRKYLIPSSFAVPIKDTVLLRIVNEGKKLNPDQAIFSCNYLNRAIFERIIYLYAKKHLGGTSSGFTDSGKFTDLVQRVSKHIGDSQPPQKKNIIQVLNETMDRKSSHCYEQMSSKIHTGSIPTGADNRIIWDRLEPVLEYLLSQLK